MYSNMNFSGINKFNIVFNVVSGNFYPVTKKKTKTKWFRVTYVMFTWLMKFLYLSSTTAGLLLYLPGFEALQNGASSGIASIETIALSAHMYRQRETLRNLIGKIDNILVDSEILQNCIWNTVEPQKKRLKMYTIATVGSVFMWIAMPVSRIFSNQRSYESNDFSLPTYVPGLPVNVFAFLGITVIQTLGVSYMTLKRIGTDVYVNYLITLSTAQYRYVHERISAALRRENSDEDESECSTVDSLRECVQHQCDVIEIGQMLRKLLGVNVLLTYLSCILRFCFLGFFIITIPGAYIERSLYFVFTLGMLIQVYMFCSCCQDLLEASSSITDGAFHEDWYGRGTSVKRMFRTICLSSHMECRLTAFRIIDLTVPTFVAILNQAYSACLLLLRFQ